MPSDQADSTSTPAIGKRMRETAMLSSRRSPSNPGRNTADQQGRQQDADQRQHAGEREEQREDRPGHAAGLPMPALLEQLGVDRNERRAERALAEQVLQHVRHPQARAEDVGVERRAEVLGEDTLADEARDAAEQDAAGDQEGAAGGRPTRR
jgi:hypothetical protein